MKTMKRMNIAISNDEAQDSESRGDIKYLMMPLLSGASTNKFRFPSAVSWLGILRVLWRKLEMY